MMKKAVLLLTFSVGMFAAPPAYKVIGKIKIGGATRWDDVYIDSSNHRLYVSHATQTEVIPAPTACTASPLPTTLAAASPATAWITMSPSSI
jgi:hypothetical protein